MEVIKTIRPGRNGSKQYLKTYGEQLICVRYRRDQEHQRNLVTVELIVHQVPRNPDNGLPPLLAVPHDQPVYLRIHPGQLHLVDRVCRSGGRWDPVSERWVIGYGSARRLRLDGHIDIARSFPATTKR